MTAMEPPADVSWVSVASIRKSNVPPPAATTATSTPTGSPQPPRSDPPMTPHLTRVAHQIRITGGPSPQSIEVELDGHPIRPLSLTLTGDANDPINGLLTVTFTFLATADIDAAALLETVNEDRP